MHHKLKKKQHVICQNICSSDETKLFNFKRMWYHVCVLTDCFMSQITWFHCFNCSVNLTDTADCAYISECLHTFCGHCINKLQSCTCGKRLKVKKFLNSSGEISVKNADLAFENSRVVYQSMESSLSALKFQVQNYEHLIKIMREKEKKTQNLLVRVKEELKEAKQSKETISILQDELRRLKKEPRQISDAPSEFTLRTEKGSFHKSPISRQSIKSLSRHSISPGLKGIPKSPSSIGRQRSSRSFYPSRTNNLFARQSTRK